MVATEVGNKYNIDGELQPTLILEEGVTYGGLINRILQIRDIPSDSLQPKSGIHNGGSEYSVDTNVVSGVAGEEESFTQVTVAAGFKRFVLLLRISPWYGRST